MAKTKDRTSVEDWLDTLDPATTPARDARHLREVGKALNELEEAEKRLAEAKQHLATAVRTAKANGDSWGAIGAVLGTSRQAAHKRFGSEEE